MTAGSGATAVLWAVLTAIIVAVGVYLVQRLLSLRKMTDLFLQGAKSTTPMAVLMVLAFAIGDTTRAIGTGEFVARVSSGWLNAQLLPAILFLTSCVIAFSTGTSWGTFSIMIPIAIPLVAQVDASLPLALGAVLGGGIFGDHASPISDTTIIASMASASDHIDHVKTQLPYALMAGGVAVTLYLLLGFL